MCLNIGTHKTVNFPFETNGKLMVSGIPILKHFRVHQYVIFITQRNLQNFDIRDIKGLLHCFSTCHEINENNRYCFILKNVKNCKEKFQRVQKL